MTKKKKAASSNRAAEAIKTEATPSELLHEMEPPSKVPENKERPEGTAWYVIHSYSGYENKVQKNLIHQKTLERAHMRRRINIFISMHMYLSGY